MLSSSMRLFLPHMSDMWLWARSKFSWSHHMLIFGYLFINYCIQCEFYHWSVPKRIAVGFSCLVIWFHLVWIMPWLWYHSIKVKFGNIAITLNLVFHSGSKRQRQKLERLSFPHFVIVWSTQRNKITTYALCSVLVYHTTVHIYCLLLYKSWFTFLLK